MNTSSNEHELFHLLEALCNGTIAPQEIQWLQERLAADRDARHFYFDYIDLHLHLRRWQQAIKGERQRVAGESPDDGIRLKGQRRADEQQISAGQVLAPAPCHLPARQWPVPGLLGNVVNGTLGYSAGWPMAYLIATVITGLGILGFWLMPVSRPEQIARQSDALPSPLSSLPSVVGRITGLVDCKSADPGTTSLSAAVRLGQKYELASGLMEITYDTGAKVILQGPVTYEVEFNGGYLAVGKLTGKLEKSGEWRAESGEAAANHKSEIINHKSSLSTIHYPLFTIRTPTATVVDLGTEFSVEVRPDETTDVHVVRGAVEAVRDGRTGGVPVRERLVAGEAIRFESRDVPPKRIAVRPLCVATAPSPSEAWREVRDARRSALLLQPVGLVATAYHRVWDANGKLLTENDRQQAFRVATDGIFGRGEDDAGPCSSFDTFEGSGLRRQGSEGLASGPWSVASGSDIHHSAFSVQHSSSNPQSLIPNPSSAFVGLLYGCRMRFDRIKVFLGRQMGDGGNWSEMPRVFILDAPVDTGSAPPESDSAHWRELRLRQGYGMPFDSKPNANPGAVLEIPLAGFPSGERVGFGWAVGGVRGNGPAGYVSITELRAYGQRLEDKAVGSKKP